MPKLQAPENGVAVRMYRQGHGDCFLLALPRQNGGDPVYVLIDCGYKPGSPAFVHDNKIGDIVAHIRESTGSQLDLVIITHEHQDHLNGIWKKVNPFFGDFTIKQAWMAWTEAPDDALANDLRQRHHDQLLSLVNARQNLALFVGENDRAVRRVDALLSLEFGGENDTFSAAEMLAAIEDPAKSINKQGLKLIKDKASEHLGVSYLSPGGAPLDIPGSKGVRAFVIGPPRDPDLLGDEDPKGTEAFPDDNSHGFTFAAAAAGTAASGAGSAPFSKRFVISFDSALDGAEPFFTDHYGKNDDGQDDTNGIAVPDNAAWRRIDTDWLFSAELLALKLNTGINNTSLVLAFELPASKKVLLFAADAQRGNWISWKDVTWTDGQQTVKTRDLLSRTVLYKVGHHGSHNATLDGKTTDDYANLSWMATGSAAAGEFAAMITAVNEWALTKNDPPWRHPLPSIKTALTTKAQGRVFQTDEDQPKRPMTVPDGAWNAFLSRAVFDNLFFDYVVKDE